MAAVLEGRTCDCHNLYDDNTGIGRLHGGCAEG